MLLRAWKRGFSLLLLMTIVSSVVAADRACPRQEDEAPQQAAHHHGDEAPAPDSGGHCEMMLSCGTAVSMAPAAPLVFSASILPEASPIAVHYTSPHIHQKAPPPKTAA